MLVQSARGGGTTVHTSDVGADYACAMYVRCMCGMYVRCMCGDTCAMHVRVQDIME